MPALVLEKRPPAAEKFPGGGGGPALPGGDGPHDGPSGVLADPTRFGLWAFLGTITMLFVGFTSAYLVRRTASDWRPLTAPGLVWLNTAVLLASSATLETARRRLRGWDLESARTWVQATGLLGALFLAGQLGAWRILADRGIFLATNPHSSFFYLLTGLHGLHLLGGLAWFGVVLAKVRGMAYTPGEDGLSLFATYWHFLGGLWVYLAVLLFAV